jgi:hypothetical protein
MTSTEATAAANVTAAAANMTATGPAGMTAAATASALAESGIRNQQEYGECSKSFMHCSSANWAGKDSAAENR